MKRHLLVWCLMLVAILGTTAVAQVRGNSAFKPGNGPGAASFEQFLGGRIAYLVKEMKLNAQDSVQFAKAYHELTDAKGQLMRKYRNDHHSYRKIFSGENVPDSVYIRLVMNNAQLQVEDAQLEKDYLEKFSKFLTPKQLLLYQQAERKFRSEFMQRPRGNGNRNK